MFAITSEDMKADHLPLGWYILWSRTSTTLRTLLAPLLGVGSAAISPSAYVRGSEYPVRVRVFTSRSGCLPPRACCNGPEQGRRCHTELGLGGDIRAGLPNQQSDAQMISHTSRNTDRR